MKIKLGNTASCSMFPKQYEKFEAGVSFEIETEIQEEELESKVAELSNRIKEIVKKELDTKSAEYLVSSERVKKKIRTALDKM